MRNKRRKQAELPKLKMLVIKIEIESQKRTYKKLETEAKHFEKQYDKKVEKANSTGKMK